MSEAVERRRAQKQWRDKNPELVKANRLRWRRNNLLKAREQARLWIANHPEVNRANRAKRRVLETSVPLSVAEHRCIIALYAEASRRTAETGIVHHVDHDVPLALGGAHHPDNLLVVPASINLAKGARYASTWDYIAS